MRRRTPRPIADAVSKVVAASSPRTPLAIAQAGWRDAVGPQIAAVTEPVSELDGTLKVLCSSATWAEELTMMQSRILDALRESLGADAPGELRFTVR